MNVLIQRVRASAVQSEPMKFYPFIFPVIVLRGKEQGKSTPYNSNPQRNMYTLQIIAAEAAQILLEYGQSGRYTHISWSTATLAP